MMKGTWLASQIKVPIRFSSWFYDWLSVFLAWLFRHFLPKGHTIVTKIMYFFLIRVFYSKKISQLSK